MVSTMYPVKLGYEGAVSRIEALLRHGHSAEALVTTAFTIEKTVRRTLRQLVISAGFTSKAADQILKNLRGFAALRQAWSLYDPSERAFNRVVPSATLGQIEKSAEMRNKLVHGERVYSLEECAAQARVGLGALHTIKTSFDAEYGYSGWTVGKKRLRARLHVDPKVKTSI